MKVPFLDLSRQHQKIRQEIDKAISQVIDDSWFILGKKLEEFEHNFASYLDVKYAFGVGNGTDALRIALFAVGVKTGDEVLIPANTFISAPLETSFVGAKPVLIDIDEETYNLDPQKIEKKITKKTRAIIPTHLCGQPAAMNEILKLAKKHKLWVIEDACQAHGAEYKGKKVGGLGDIGCFSFYPSKNIGALGDGGMIVTNSSKLAKKIALLRNYGEKKKYYYGVRGFNSRLDPIQAAVLNVKLKYLDGYNEKRRKIANLYNHLLSGLNEIILPKENSEVKHIYYLYMIRTKKRDKLLDYLKKNNISCLIHYPIPIHLQQSFKYLGYKKGDLPVTEKCAEEIISLPMFPELTFKEIKYVCDKIKEFFVTK